MTTCKSFALTGGMAGTRVSAGMAIAGVVRLSDHGQMRPATACISSTARPSAVAIAASFARKIVRARIGNGARTSTSRSSGNIDPQLKIAKRPTASMVVAMRKCSNRHEKNNRSGADNSELRSSAGIEIATLKNRRIAAICVKNSWASPPACADSSSRSTTRKRNSRYRIRNDRFGMRPSVSAADQIRHLTRHGARVLFDGELGENLLERRQRHQRPEFIDRIVGDDLTAVQNDHPRRDP